MSRKGSDDSITPMGKMDAMMRQLLAVPKSEISRREAAYKAKRKKHKAK